MNQFHRLGRGGAASLCRYAPAVLLAVFLAVILLGCSPRLLGGDRYLRVDQIAKGYQPIDPEPVDVPVPDGQRQSGDHASYRRDFVRSNLTNTLTRIAVGRLDTTGTVRFGPVEVGHKGQSYVVVVDRILYSTSSVRVEYLLADLDVTSKLKDVMSLMVKEKFIKKGIRAIPTDLTLQMMHEENSGEYFGIFSQMGDQRYRVLLSYAQSESDFTPMADLVGAEVASTVAERLRGLLRESKGEGEPAQPDGAGAAATGANERVAAKSGQGRAVVSSPGVEQAGLGVDAEQLSTRTYDEKSFYSVPVYVGVGVRMRFELSVLDGEVNLTSYSSFGGNASANKVQGTVTLQTIGISSPHVAELIPSPVDISDASVPVVLQSLMTIFSKIYDDDDDLNLQPQVLGFDSPAILHGGAAFLESVVRNHKYSMYYGDGSVMVVDADSRGAE